MEHDLRIEAVRVAYANALGSDGTPEIMERAKVILKFLRDGVTPADAAKAQGGRVAVASLANLPDAPPSIAAAFGTNGGIHR